MWYHDIYRGVIDDIAAFYVLSRYTPDTECLHHTLCQEVSEMLLNFRYQDAMHYHLLECDNCDNKGCGQSYAMQTLHDVRSGKDV